MRPPVIAASHNKVRAERSLPSLKILAAKKYCKATSKAPISSGRICWAIITCAGMIASMKVASSARVSLRRMRVPSYTSSKVNSDTTTMK